MNDIKYKISKVPPPIYAKAKEKFPIDFYKGVVFTYGETIHIANPNHLTDDLIAHESVHIRQQMNYPGGAEFWWNEYLSNETFRFEQEIEAYRTQYQYVLKYFNKRLHWQKLRFYGESLVQIYRLGGLTVVKAMDIIKAEGSL